MLIYDDDRPENVRSVIVWTSGFLVAGYVIMNAFIPNNDINIALGILQGVMASVVLVYYIWAAIRAIWTGSNANADYLIVGIVLSWISQDGQAWLSVVTRMTGFPPSLVNSELFAPLKLLSVIAAVLHVVPKGAANGVVPRSSKAVIGVFLALAVAMAVGALTLRPDLNGVVNGIPDWLRDTWRTGQTVPKTQPIG